VQIAPDLDSADGTVAKVCQAIAEAAAQGAQLVVFPETFVPYYPYFSFVRPPLRRAEHLLLYERAVRARSGDPGGVGRGTPHGMVVVLGVNERDHGTLYNTQLVFDADGELVLKRRKITPTYHERMIWGQGDASGLKVVPTAVGAWARWPAGNTTTRWPATA
jgi:aliphatic nitrilase